ncbi:PTS glucose transporter subunit IIA [Streptococcus danieliae]|uniref:PTS system sucrose-specific EIIBCA component n=1 Tax=Streptococcus danieliae TaxID=747656 RepID=A0A7Z0LD61_9STRE|nr:beta-glucoside-specific PTS transporter subunit IIABC [Streptococcus danieliae]MBF0717287.1 PTS glucose transporter subunit IIA [Streptococcus danieliae]NYS49217.1 PTS glucose transporter subunit IIA [Streptococcus danieliae]
MAKDYSQLAKDIVDHVGGRENIKELKHCITRLRFSLKDEGKVDTDYLKARDGIVTVVQAGGQYQVVIGNHVPDVYVAVQTAAGIVGNGSLDIDEGDKFKGNLFERFVDLISGIFQPFLGALAAAGILKGLVAILGANGITAANSALYAILNAAGDGFFQYLPFIIALTSARKFKVNEFTALAIGAALVYPSLPGVVEGLTEAGLNRILGIPFSLPAGGYYSTVLPTILAVWVASYIERGARKVIPDVVKLFLVPFVTLLLAVPMTFLVVGPVGNLLSDALSWFFQLIMEISPVLYGVVLGGLWQVMVMFGMHWAIVPLAIVETVSQGFSTILVPALFPSFTQVGVLLAIMLKSKEAKVKSLSLPALISAIFGITEPAIYGITLPMRTPFIVSCMVSALIGGYVMFAGIVAYSVGGLGIFLYPSLIDTSNGSMSGVISSIIASVAALVISFGVQMALPVANLYGDGAEALDEKEDEPMSLLKEIQQEIVASPLEGTILSLADVPDPVFASGAMGKGLAIEPSQGILYAPAKGEITLLFPSKHALGMRTENGAEILFHIGMDTVSLQGAGFDSFVEVGDRIEAGQKLLAFDIEKIQAAGLPITTPIIITNTSLYKDILVSQERTVQVGDYLLTTVS